MNKMDEIINKLQAPTPTEHIKFVPKNVIKSQYGEDEHVALATPHVDIAFVRQRLDDACGPFGWTLETKEVNGLTFAGIGIKNPDTQEWVYKWDTGQDEPYSTGGEDEGDKYSMSARGIFSTCVKRAAYQWGVARDVLNIRLFYCKCEVSHKNNKPYFKKWIENPLSKMFNGKPPAGPATETNADDVAEARKKTEAFAKECYMTDADFPNFARPYLLKTGETLASYRDIWNALKLYKETYETLKVEFERDPNHIEVTSNMRAKV